MHAAGCTFEWLEMVESEHGFLLAMARLESEKRKEQRAAREAEREEIEREMEAL